MSHIFAALPIVLILTSQGPPGPSPAEKQRFEAAKVEAGTSPAKLVKLALWCEAHGMRTEQRAALEEAVRLDPNNKAAHGLLGQVLYQGRWETPEAVTQRVKDDDALTAKLAEYNARRARIDRDTEIERRAVDDYEKAGFHAKAGDVKLRLDRRIAPEHIRLGLWCEQERAEARGTGPLHDGPAAQPAQRGDVAAPRIHQAPWPVDEPRADRRRRA